MGFPYIILLFGWYLCLFLDGSATTCGLALEEDSLKLVHVLFRHGNRTPNGPDELYPKDPYLNATYFPFGLGQLTNMGKMLEYDIGRRLRTRYNNFLGKYCLPETVEARSTYYNRTKMSLELVLASLYPPQDIQIWNPELLWLPIPYNYFSKPNDRVLLGVVCPHYERLYNAIINSPKLQKELKNHKNIFDYISYNTGLNVTTFLDVYNLNFGLQAEDEWGFKLPPWTKKVYPKTMRNLAIKEYFVATATTDLIRMASGWLLEKIINDSKAHINGQTSDRKIYLYSAHENNIAEMLITLGVFKNPHIPNYGSHIIFELHKINGIYGFKIFYQNYQSYIPQQLKLPSCQEFCKLDEFLNLYKEYIPPSNFTCKNN